MAFITSVVPSAILTILPGLLAGLIAALVVRKWLLKTSSHSYPPGPSGWPVVGNAFDFPQVDQGRAFRDLCTQYGAYPCL